MATGPLPIGTLLVGEQVDGVVGCLQGDGACKRPRRLHGKHLIPAKAVIIILIKLVAGSEPSGRSTAGVSIGSAARKVRIQQPEGTPVAAQQRPVVAP